MISLIDFLVSDEAILVYLIALVISVMYIIFYFIRSRKESRKLKHNTMELKRLSEEVIDVAKSRKDKLPALEEVLETKEEKVAIPEAVTPIVETKEQVIEKPQEVMPVVENIEREEPKEVQLKESEVAVEEISPVYDTVVEESQIEKAESQIKYTTIAPEKDEAIKELEETKEKLETEEERDISLTEFEKLQEQTAIISLEELMKKASEMYEQNEETQYLDDGNEPISLQEIEQRKKEIKEEEIAVHEKVARETDSLTIDDFINVKITPIADTETVEVKETKPVSKFRNSPVISPIYGIEGDEGYMRNNELELENTADYEKLDEEIRKTNQFIATLKELQKDLK